MEECKESVIAALEAGLIKAIFKAHPLLFLIQSTGPGEVLFEPLSNTILESVAKFLVFPDVLHSFLKVLNRMEKDGMFETSGIRDKSTIICKSWEHTPK